MPVPGGAAAGGARVCGVRLQLGLGGAACRFCSEFSHKSGSQPRWLGLFRHGYPKQFDKPTLQEIPGLCFL